MNIEDYNNHGFHESISNLEYLTYEKKQLLAESKNEDLRELLDSIVSVKEVIDERKNFIKSDDLDKINSGIIYITKKLSELTWNNSTAIFTSIHLRSVRISLILKKQSIDCKTTLETALIDAEKIKEIKANVEHLFNEVKDLCTESATALKAQLYGTTSESNEKKADTYLKYTKYSMFAALIFTLLPTFVKFGELFVNKIDFYKLYLIPIDITFGAALLRISITLVSFFPVIFFAKMEQKYRDRAFKFKDLKNAILSINPYLADITPNENNEYDIKDEFKVEMAKVFFTQIHSTKKTIDKDAITMLEQLVKITKDFKQCQ